MCRGRYSVGLGNGFDGAKEKIKHHLVDAQTTAWAVWIPVQYFNFYVMPLHMRVIFVQLWFQSYL